jgi:hypothetical protein
MREQMELKRREQVELKRIGSWQLASPLSEAPVIERIVA